MNKKLFKLLSISALLVSIAVPCVEGTKKWSQKKAYSHSKKMLHNQNNRSMKNEFVRALTDILQLPEFVNFNCYFKIDKRYSNPIILKLKAIRDQQKFNECFSMLVTAAGNLNDFPKTYCLQLMENLISFGNRKGFTLPHHNQFLANLRNNSIARILDFNNIANIVNNQGNNNSINDPLYHIIADSSLSSIQSPPAPPPSPAWSESSHITTYFDPNE